MFRYQNTFFHIIHLSLNLREAKNKSNIINFATGDPEGLPVAQSGWFESFFDQKIYYKVKHKLSITTSNDEHWLPDIEMFKTFTH